MCGEQGGGAGDVHLCRPPYKGTWIPYRWYWRITFLHRCSSDSLWTKTWTAMSRYQSSQRKKSRWMLQPHQAILQRWQVCVGRFHSMIRTGYHRQLHSAIPGIFREGAKKNPNLPQILQKVLWHWHWLWINVYNEGPRDLGSKLVLTLQTGEWIHLREYRAKLDFPHLPPQADPPSLDLSARGAASGASLWERGGQREEDADGHGARVTGGKDGWWLIIHTELIEETRNSVWNNNDLLQPMPVLPAESPPPQSRSDQLVTLLAASHHAASSPPAGDPPRLLHTSPFLSY